MWHAAASRMLALERVNLDTPNSSAPKALTTSLVSDERPENDGGLEAHGLGIVAGTSGGTTLLADVCFQWNFGDRIVILGPAGCGKSMLLRAIAGAWPPPATGGIKHIGESAKVMLVSSKGFLLPTHASLRKCLAYPEAVSAFDEDLKDALLVCGLGHLATQLDAEGDWTADLSMADKQRLAFARLLAHWPQGVHWLLLDDLASALSETTALTLHLKLASQLPRNSGLVVVSRHSQVQSHFDSRRFHIDPDLKTLKEELPAQASGVCMEASPATGETPSSDCYFQGA